MTRRRKTSPSPLLAGWLFADLLLGVTIIMLGAQAPFPSDAQPRPEAVRPLPEAVRSMPNITQPWPSSTPSPTEKSTPKKSPAKTPSPATSGPAKKSPSENGSARKSPDESGPAKKGPATRRPPARSGPSVSPSPCADRLGDVQSKPLTISFRTVPGAGDDALAAQVRQELLKYRDRLAGRHAGMVLTFGADGAAGNGVRLAARVNTAVREAYPRIFGTAVIRNFHDLAAPSGSISMEVYLMTYGCSPTRHTTNRSTRP